LYRPIERSDRHPNCRIIHILLGLLHVGAIPAGAQSYQDFMWFPADRGFKVTLARAIALPG
jgi:hypothetical protein